MDLSKITTPINNAVDKAMSVIRFIAETAKNIDDFRNQLARRALEGDLDDSYEHLRHAEERRQRFIESGE